MRAAGILEKTVPFAASVSQAACSGCGLKRLCMPIALSYPEMEGLDAMIGAPRRLKRGRYLYRTGDPFKAIYVVRAGFFKTGVLRSNGQEQVAGFQMVGELLGLDGISNEVHSCDAVALEDSQVCLIPFGELEALACGIPALQRHFHKLMSREIVRDQGVMMLLGTLRAEGRLAAFLLNLSQRFAVRGYSPTDFHLRMTRDEIGSYLGLHLGTVSHAFSRFQEEGLVAVHLKHIQILDVGRLKSAMGRAGHHYS